MAPQCSCVVSIKLAVDARADAHLLGMHMAPQLIAVQMYGALDSTISPRAHIRKHADLLHAGRCREAQQPKRACGNNSLQNRA